MNLARYWRWRYWDPYSGAIRLARGRWDVEKAARSAGDELTTDSTSRRTTVQDFEDTMPSVFQLENLKRKSMS